MAPSEDSHSTRKFLGIRSETQASTQNDPLAYKLPALVNAVQRSWEISLRTGLILSASLAIASLLLLSVIERSITTPEVSASETALLVLSYASIILNLGGTVDAFILIDELGDTALKASRRDITISYPISSMSIIRNHGIRSSWIWIMFHWTCLHYAGIFSFFAELVLYSWLRHSIAVRVSALALTVVAALPTVLVFVPGG
ncbi:hypothetical protein C8J56DRAFT_1172531 [Mycena floridula]|nr:hypothetical protein C8J56DRAFT_1172531 [Mycena floridula]